MTLQGMCDGYLLVGSADDLLCAMRDHVQKFVFACS